MISLVLKHVNWRKYKIKCNSRDSGCTTWTFNTRISGNTFFLSFFFFFLNIS